MVPTVSPSAGLACRGFAPGRGRTTGGCQPGSRWAGRVRRGAFSSVPGPRGRRGPRRCRDSVPYMPSNTWATPRTNSPTVVLAAARGRLTSRGTSEPTSPTTPRSSDRRCLGLLLPLYLTKGLGVRSFAAAHGVALASSLASFSRDQKGCSLPCLISRSHTTVRRRLEVQ